MVRRLWGSLLCWLVSMAVVGPSHVCEAAPHVEIEAAADGCDVAAVRAAVDGLAATSTSAPLVRVVIARRGDHYAALVVAGSGSRTVAASTCAELGDAIALVVAMAGDEPVVRAPEPAIARPVATTPSPAAGAVFVGALGGSSGAGIDVGGHATLPHDLQLGVDAQYEPERGHAAVSLMTGDTVGIRVQRILGTAAICRTFDTVAVCGTATAGAVTGTNVDTTGSSATVPALALGARLAWEPRLTTHLALRASIEVRAPLTRPRFLVDDMAVWRAPPAEVWAGIAAVVLIP